MTRDDHITHLQTVLLTVKEGSECRISFPFMENSLSYKLYGSSVAEIEDQVVVLASSDFFQFLLFFLEISVLRCQQLNYGKLPE